MKSIQLCIVFLFLSFISLAQFQPYGHLTIFSEDGDRFFLILNGERMNDEPQTNLRVEELNQPYYSAKIIFENKSIPSITKKFLQITDVDGVFKDVTYKIKRNRNKKLSLNYFSMIPVQPDFIPPSNMFVTRFGGGVQQNPHSNGLFNGQYNGNGTSVQMNVSGNGVNLQVNDQNFNRNNNLPPNNNYNNQGNFGNTNNNFNSSTNINSNNCFRAAPMSPRDFEAAKTSISKQNFDDTRLKVAKQIINANCLSTNQIKDLCQLFSFEDNKLQLAQYAYDYCIDRKNYFQLNDIFKFSSNVETLTEFIQNR